MSIEESKEARSLVARPERSEGAATNDAAMSTEVSAHTTRRRFGADYKRRILREADVCKKPGELGAMLRREGLYSSTLSQWRAARASGEIAGLIAKRGPKTATADGRDKVIAEQKRQIGTLTRRAEQAEAIIEIQKKISLLLGIQLAPSNEECL